jgi:transposase
MAVGPRDNCRRRQWSDDDKARIVTETLRPSAVVIEVARRWQLSSQQLFEWRRQARRGTQEVTAATAPEFLPIMSDALPAMPGPVSTATPPSSPVPLIKVKLDGAVLRIAPGGDAALLTMVLRAVRAPAACSPCLPVHGSCWRPRL